MRRTLVLDLPGLNRRLLSMLPADRRPAWLNRLTSQGESIIEPVLPGVTLTAQATLTTGKLPQDHGMIANGLATYRDTALHEHIDLGDDSAAFRQTVSFWEQSNNLLQTPRVWAKPGQSAASPRVALLFFQSSMGAADVVVTPKPTHTEDGQTISNCWTNPPALNDRLNDELGIFPLHHYWGPMASIESSKWIAACARIVWAEHTPDLQLTYVPHLDYDAQRLGPTHPKTVEALTEVLAVLSPLVEQVEADGGRVILLSEYGMTNVTRTIAPNVALRAAGLLPLAPSEDRMAAPDIDYANVKAFALCDHQVAHVYTSELDAALAVVGNLPGVASVHVGDDRATIGLNTDRAGDIVLLADEDAWFEYRWWDNFDEAPPWAWSVDIHRKPGYDPTEMFFDPQNKRIRADQPQLVKGSHGARPSDQNDWPVLLGVATDDSPVAATDIANMLIDE